MELGSLSCNHLSRRPQVSRYTGIYIIGKIFQHETSHGSLSNRKYINIQPEIVPQEIIPRRIVLLEIVLTTVLCSAKNPQGEIGTN